MKHLGKITLIAAVAFFLLAFFVVRPIMNVGSPGPLNAAIEVHVPLGAHLPQIADILLTSGAIQSSWIFKWQVKIFGAPERLQAGYYKFLPHTSPATIMDMLQSGRFEMVLVTIPEGLTNYQIKLLLEADTNFSGTVDKMPAEGWLLPETYKVPKGSSPQVVIDHMYVAMRQFLSLTIQDRSTKTDLSEDEILVLASIVEKETAVPSERGRVACLFLNRLRSNMRLQADPTVVYGITAGRGRLERHLSREDLKKDMPHNTYVYKGLPPTAIANPSKEAILAVINPAKTKDLYFVADGLGLHRFACNLSDHKKNVFKLRRHERQQRQKNTSLKKIKYI